ncbi:MAG TPA: type 2 isopentenyl-diphosphate Delta-isomerase [Beijerinckiaceae bacterium]
MNDSTEEGGARNIERRKNDHLDIVLSGRGASSADAGFRAVRFAHCALPELDLAEVDVSATFLGRRLSAPLLISSMTGGPARAEAVNRHLAEAAQSVGVAFAVGSQRSALAHGLDAGVTRKLRDWAPDVPLLANFGAAQLVAGFGVDEARRAVEMIGADGLILHLNPLQEAVQAGGDRDWRGVLAAIERLARAAATPIVVKEVGHGLSGAVARRLYDAGVTILDVAGAGGINWALVEGRRGDAASAETAEAFADWGVPTATAVREVRAACPDAIVIASGGVKTGVDVAKALRLGADLAGQASATLAAATISTQDVVAHFETIVRQLRITCFATGSKDIAALKQAPLIADPA